MADEKRFLLKHYLFMFAIFACAGSAIIVRGNKEKRVDFIMSSDPYLFCIKDALRNNVAKDSDANKLRKARLTCAPLEVRFCASGGDSLAADIEQIDVADDLFEE